MDVSTETFLREQAEELARALQREDVTGCILNYIQVAYSKGRFDLAMENIDKLAKQAGEDLR